MSEKQFVDLMDAPYSRRGSYLAFANDNHGEDVFGKSTLWLCNCRTLGTTMLDLTAPSNFRQIKLEALKDGRPLPCRILTTPYEVILETAHGQIRFCIGERDLVMARSTDGLGLSVGLLPRVLSAGPMDMMSEGRWLIDFNMTRLLLTPVSGKLTAGQLSLTMQPDEKGVMELVFEDDLIDPVPRPVEELPSYEDCVASVMADFDSFCEMVMPSLPEEFEEVRLQALWQTWNMIVLPDGESDYKRPMVKMIHCIFESAFVWQQPMQAIWLSRDPDLSWQVFCSSFDFMDANGRMKDAVAFRAAPGGPSLKPPVHGLALLWLMEHGVYDDVPPEEKQWLLERLIKWTEYFLNFRDKDGDGLCEFQSPLETGWEDAPQYLLGFPQASPDLNAFLALQMEAVARFGAVCGMPEEEYTSWMERSRELTDRLVKAFWDGSKWVSFNAATGQRSDNTNIALYMPLLLGDRLPREIIDKSIQTMFSENGFYTPYGLASEALGSDTFRNGFTQGSIITPAEFLSCLALDACGRNDLAKKVAGGYCRALKEHGFFHIYNALTGKEDRSLTAFGEKGLFWSAWASSCYFFLADRYCGE